jgi:hypothetical protein
MRTLVSSGPPVAARGTAARGVASPVAPKSMAKPPKGEVVSDIGMRVS